MKYLIANNGCDDITYTEMELNYFELQLILKYARLNNKNSRYGCQPTISVYQDYEKQEDGYYNYFHKSKDEDFFVDNLDLVTGKSGEDNEKD